MSTKRDYYEILGVDRNASEDQIKKAFYKLSMKYHPDKTEGNVELEEKFKEANEAYEHLSDETKKAKYDQFGHGQQQQGFNGNPFEDILRAHGFNMGDFTHQNRVRRGADLTVSLKFTLEELYKGLDYKFTYKREANCVPCNGKGGKGEKTCPTCNGQGRVVRVLQHQFGTQQIIQDCPTCQTHGKLTETNCEICNGKGTSSIDETIEFTIPSGINDGAEFIIEDKGQGLKNGVNGKLKIIILETPHKDFIRQGNDLKYNLKLNYSQLVLGDKVDIPTIDGKKIRIPVPEYSNIGDNLRVNGKGMKIYKQDDHGDLILVLDIVIPKKINAEERKLISKLKDIENKI